MNIDFLKPAQIDDVLEVSTEPADVMGASVILRQRVKRGEEDLVAASVRVAFVSGRRARPIPPSRRGAMQADRERAALGSKAPSR
jgi:acyl-CoA thioester hydrolase